MDLNAGADDDSQRYVVLVNREGQYCLWLADKAIPGGWQDTGTRGAKSDCLAYVERVWEDITPVSVRNRAAAGQSAD